MERSAWDETDPKLRLTREEWVVDASCKDHPFPEIFYPIAGGNADEARRVCSGCPVVFECLRTAINNTEKWGIWGGLSARERGKAKKHDNLRKVVKRCSKCELYKYMPEPKVKTCENCLGR